MPQDLWIIMLVLGFVGLLISVILFFVWNIPDILEELSGKKARRQIQSMREDSSTTGALGKFVNEEVYVDKSNNALSLTKELDSIKYMESVDEGVGLPETSEEVVEYEELSEDSIILPEGIDESSVEGEDNYTVEDNEVNSTVLMDVEEESTKFLEENEEGSSVSESTDVECSEEYIEEIEDAEEESSTVPLEEGIEVEESSTVLLDTEISTQDLEGCGATSYLDVDNDKDIGKLHKIIVLEEYSSL